MKKYKSVFDKNTPEFTKCSVLEHIANELAEANRLKKIELKHSLRFELTEELKKEIEGES